jgi:hypothetical protein
MSAPKKISAAVVDATASDDLHPSLRNIIDQPSLNWIFVGGKGILPEQDVAASFILNTILLHRWRW